MCSDNELPDYKVSSFNFTNSTTTNEPVPRKTWKILTHYNILADIILHFTTTNAVPATVSDKLAKKMTNKRC